MLEQASARLLRRGEAHWASPDKQPQARLETIRLAGESNERPGYATLVRLFAPGYIRGLEQSAF